MNKRIAWRNCKVLKFQNSSVKFWEIPQFQNSPVNFWEIPKFQNSQIPKFRNSKIPKFQNSKIPKFQNSKIPKFQNSEIPKFQNSKIPKKSSHFFGIPIVNSLWEFWKFQKIDWIFFGILEFWIFGILEFWNFQKNDWIFFWNFGLLVGNSKIPKFQNSKIPKFRNSKIPKFQNSKKIQSFFWNSNSQFPLGILEIPKH